jgi:hypothetical protein
MATEPQLQHDNGLRRKAFIGFSWTGFFFGPFPSMFRGDWLGAFAYLLAAVVVGGLTAGLALPVLWIVWGFIYNGWHTRRLVMKGFKVVGAGIPLDLARARVFG